MSVTQPQRQLIHTREIKTQVYKRDDGLWDLEASLIDTKGKDFPLAEKMRPAGVPIHHMVITVTIDTRFNILDASAESVQVPYPGYCQQITPDYKKLVGLNLVQGFRSDVKRLFEGVAGCSHITELCLVLPTVAIQGFAAEVFSVPGSDQHATQMPFQLNRCHALKTDGEVVKKHYEPWYGVPVSPAELPKFKK